MSGDDSKKTQKFYAVSKGRKPGIFLRWNDCHDAVNGYPGAEFKGYTTLETAKTAMSCLLLQCMFV